jgi:tryptophanyl-tRNA synthetase
MKTARPIRGAKTDAKRHISYDTERRPEVANLLQIAALCLERPPEQIADQIADRGPAPSSTSSPTRSTNTSDRSAPTAPSLQPERDYPRSVLHNGNDRAREIASATLETVHELMHTTY